MSHRRSTLKTLQANTLTDSQTQQKHNTRSIITTRTARNKSEGTFPKTKIALSKSTESTKNISWPTDFDPADSTQG